jgi:hypothetical protein
MMNDFQQALAELAFDAANEGNHSVYKYLIEKLATSQSPPNITVEQQALFAKDHHCSASLTTAAQVGRICRQYVRSKKVGDVITFVSLKEHVEATPGLVLDREIVLNERRERWRNQVSMAISRMKDEGILGPSSKTSHYVLLRHP